jgi:hypothetical protein
VNCIIILRFEEKNGANKKNLRSAFDRQIVYKQNISLHFTLVKAPALCFPRTAQLSFQENGMVERRIACKGKDTLKNRDCIHIQGSEK